MLRTNIDLQLLGLEHNGTDPSSLSFLLIATQILIALARKVFAHWKAFKFIPHIDSPQVRMTDELNTEQIKSFTFVEIGCRPMRSQRWHLRRITWHPYSQDNSWPTGGMVEAVNQLKTSCVEIIDHRNIG
jgi:hypothetical protein